MDYAISFIFPLAILVFSVVVHEVSHGYAALWLGDDTAERSGRLTLNPLNHIDPFGSLLLPIVSYLAGGFILGWAKPVPYNPYRLRNKKWGPAIVGAAGPASNIFLALAFGLMVRFLPGISLVSGTFLLHFISILSMIVLTNLLLALFNFIPIPPLDGSKVLFALLPYQWRWVENFLEQYGLFLLIPVVLFFGQWIFPFVLFFFQLITGSAPFF